MPELPEKLKTEYLNLEKLNPEKCLLERTLKFRENNELGETIEFFRQEASQELRRVIHKETNANESTKISIQYSINNIERSSRETQNKAGNGKQPIELESAFFDIAKRVIEEIKEFKSKTRIEYIGQFSPKNSAGRQP